MLVMAKKMRGADSALSLLFFSLLFSFVLASRSAGPVARRCLLVIRLNYALFTSSNHERSAGALVRFEPDGRDQDELERYNAQEGC
jgi:hypothetical protein